MNKQDVIRHIRDDRLHKGYACITPQKEMERWSREELDNTHAELHQVTDLPFTHPHAG